MAEKILKNQILIPQLGGWIIHRAGKTYNAPCRKGCNIRARRGVADRRWAPCRSFMRSSAL